MPDLLKSLRPVFGKASRTMWKNCKISPIQRLVVLYIISRCFFLADFPHFYDGPEYLRESLKLDYFQSLKNSHTSIHPISLFLNQQSQKFTANFAGNNGWSISFVALVFGLIGLLSFYYIIKYLFDQKIAFYSTLPLLLFSHLWLIQTNILHEAVDQGLFLLGFLFWVKFLEKNKHGFLIMAGLCLSLAVVNFIGTLIWFPLIIGVILLNKKYSTRENLIWGAIIMLTSGLLATIILSSLLQISGINFGERLHNLFFIYGGGGVFQKWGIAPLFRALRNIFLITTIGYSPLIFIAFYSSLSSFSQRREWGRLGFVLLFFFLFILTGKFWYGGLFGRYSALIGYLFGLMIGIMGSRNKFGMTYWLLVACLLINFIPTFLAYQKTPIPLIQAALIKKAKITDRDLLILSDYQRPQLPLSNGLFINGDLNLQRKIEEQINQSLLSGQRVFVTEQAVTFPYFQYDGQQLHIISMGDKSKAVMRLYLQNKKLELVVEDKNYPLLNLYEIK